MNALRYTRNLAGVLIKDWRRYRLALRAPDGGYLAICNRNERLVRAPDGRGYRCDWQWTSDLHAPKYVPSLGSHLMRRALGDHPVRRAAAPPRLDGAPDVSFVIGHRGTDRLPLLLATLESIAGQQDAGVECLVVEQDAKAQIAAQLPAWVRHVHTPPPTSTMPYCRSWAFNVGFRCTRGRVLVLHDNDMLVPSDYATRILERVGQGFEVVNLKRFIFYLNEQHTRVALSDDTRLTDAAPLSVMQNSEGGGSIAITTRAYERIGGMDELFMGWGGEDNEFWERAQTCKVWPFADLPFVHLWHRTQAEKSQRSPVNAEYHRLRSQVPAEERIAELRARDFGNVDQPAPRGLAAIQGT